MRALPLWIVVTACRPDIGAPLYREIDPWTDSGDPFLPGPDPYQPGVERLALGRFYEGEASEIVPIDDVSAHYYIYENTYTEVPSDDRVEGLEAAALALLQQPWWGGGIHWDSPRDLTAWKTLRLSLKSSDRVFDTFSVGMVGGLEARVRAADHGFVADGEWHHLAIPMAELVAAGLDASQVTVALLLVSDAAAADATLLVDAVYLTKEAP